MVLCQDDVFVINRCYGKNDPKSKLAVYENGEFCKGARIFKNDGGRHYTVCLYIYWASMKIYHWLTYTLTQGHIWILLDRELPVIITATEY